ncbi:hypothetical protein ACJZ2D_007322 [Fusarium nematophilum]
MDAFPRWQDGVAARATSHGRWNAGIRHCSTYKEAKGESPRASHHIAKGRGAGLPSHCILHPGLVFAGLVCRSRARYRDPFPAEVYAEWVSRNKGTETSGETTTHQLGCVGKGGGFSGQRHTVPGDTGILSTSRSGRRLRLCVSRAAAKHGISSQAGRHCEKRDEETRPMTMKRQPQLRAPMSTPRPALPGQNPRPP